MKQLPLYILSGFVVLFAFLNRFEAFGHTVWEWATLAGHVGILAGIILFFTYRKTEAWLRDNATLIAFVVTLAATTGSLSYSQIAGYAPCTLCWFQRIFMYPLPLLLGIAYWNGDSIGMYVRWMAGIGGVIAFFHYLTQFFTKYFRFMDQCGLSGPDCADKLTFFLGYITIPMMAFTAFVIVFVLPYGDR